MVDQNATHHFEDHFSKHSQTYAQYRPQYPEEIYAYLASIAPGRSLAWDCGTGNGQAALGLAKHFEQVYATDASAEQIARAYPYPNINYHVEPAEHISLPDSCVDLITVAVAIHWFSFDEFYREVKRVLKPNGILAAWTYNSIEVSAEIDRLVEQYSDEILHGYWPDRIRLLEDGYKNIPFPFEEIEPPLFNMQADWTLDQLAGFLNSWSATQRYKEQNGHHPLEQIWEKLLAAWGNESETRLVRWPLHFRIGKKSFLKHNLARFLEPISTLRCIRGERHSAKEMNLNWLKSHWRWSALNGSAVCILVYVLTQGTTGWERMDTFDSGLESGKWAVRFLLFSLIMTPLNTHFGWSSGIKLRKSAGLWAFGFACAHILFYLRETPLIWLTWPLPDYLVFGMIGFGILSVMAATSNNWSMKRLAKQWKRLHRRVYIAGMAIMAHSMLATVMSKKLLVRDPEAQRELSIYAAVFCVLLIVRIPVVRTLLLQIPTLLKRTRGVQKPVVVESVPQIPGRESGVSVEPTFMIAASSRKKKAEERILHRPFAPIDAFGETNPSQTEEKEFVQD